MPMGTDTPDQTTDTGHTPPGPSAGSLLTPAELAAKRADLQAQLAALPPQTPAPADAVPTPAPTPVPVQAQESAAEKIADTAEADVAGAENAFSHWLHLADGRVLKSLGVYTTHHDTDDPNTPGIPVVAAVANPKYVAGSGDTSAKKKSLLAELAALGIDLTHLL